MEALRPRPPGRSRRAPRCSPRAAPAAPPRRRPGLRLHAPVALAAAALLLDACAAREALEVELGGYAFEYAFLVVYDGRGAPTRVTAPFGVEDGKVSFGAPPALELTDDEASLVVVGLDRARLSLAAPGFQAERAAELHAAVAPPPAAPIFDPAAGDLGVRFAAIPADALLLGPRVTASGPDLRALAPVDRASVPALDAITLHVPVDPEYCRIPEETPVAPFGAAAAPLGGLSGAEYTPFVQRAAWLDARTLVLLTFSHVAVLTDSDATVAPEGAVEINPEPPDDEDGVWPRGLAVDPTSPPGGPWRVVASAGRMDRHEGYLWDLTVDATHVRLDQRTVLPERAQSILFDPDGRLLVATGTGEVLMRAPGATELVPHSRIEVYAADERELVTILATNDAAWPYLAGSRTRLHLYDERDGHWRYEQLLQDGLAAAEPLELDVLAAGRTPEGELELWAGAQRGVIFRKLGGAAWARVRPVYPPRFAPCGGLDDETGQIILDRDVRAMAMSDGWVHLAPGLCNATLRVRRSDLCTSLLPHEEPIERSLVELNSFAVAPGRLVMAGALGIVLQSTWPEGK